MDDVNTLETIKSGGDLGQRVLILMIRSVDYMKSAKYINVNKYLFYYL